GATADAVQLLHDQCESGKDMMKLMSDLMAYLRDLLVFKVKPDALSDDVNTDVQKRLSAQVELVETDRLLELIDGFAEAEGRMKWAPNKKLHFEVALIKAIQMLNQVTLNEVIENLNALRDGKVVVGGADPGRANPPAKPAGAGQPASEKSGSKAAGVGERASEKSPPKPAGANAPGDNKGATETAAK